MTLTDLPKSEWIGTRVGYRIRNAAPVKMNMFLYSGEVVDWGPTRVRVKLDNAPRLATPTRSIPAEHLEVLEAKW